MEQAFNPEEGQKEQDLRRNKRRALLLLGFFVGLFVVANIYEVNWLKAISEAAMVGGIADWFAVVALFKHPLGIPIRHTALIPSKKDKIGENLGNFVSGEFLTKEKLEQKIEQFDVAKKVSSYLMEQQHAQQLSRLLAQQLLPAVLKAIDDEQLQGFVQRRFSDRLYRLNFAQWVALALESLAQSQRQEQMVTRLLKTLIVELENNKHVIESKVKSATPFLSFGLADRRITEGVFNGLYDFLLEASRNDSSIRQRINAYVMEFIEELKSSEELQQKLNELILGIAQRKEVQDYINGIWQEIKRAITEDLALNTDSAIQRGFVGLVRSFGQGIAEDYLIQEKINNFVKVDVLRLLLHNKKMIGELIASTVKSWDPAEVSRKLELEIGSDLQYIRISGTVVGGLIGLLIYGVEMALQQLIL